LFRVEPPANLSAEESAELSARVAALARSGLPLEGGLYALADEVAQPRLARVLGNLAQRLEAGEKLETAIAAQGSRLPAHLRGLIVAGVRTGRLPIVLDHFAAMARRQQELRRRVFLALAYPILLLAILTAIMVFCGPFLSEQFNKVFRDFGMKLPLITEIYISCSGMVAWVMVGLLIVAMVVPLAARFLPLGAWLGRAASWIPILRTIVRHERHVQFSSLMALLLEEEVPLPEALRLASLALEGSMLPGQCRAAATAVEKGAPLDQALALARFPDSLTALVAWGEQQHSPAAAFRSAAEAFEARTNSQSALLKTLVPPLIYMIIISLVGIMILALMIPLISLLENLTGGPSHKNPELLAGATLILTIVPTLWLACLAVMIAMAYGRNVASQQYAMLALVGAAAERSMPLDAAFAAFGSERGGWMRKRATELVSLLREGTPLPAALEAVPGVLPPEAVPLVCVGYENGSLGPAAEKAITARNCYEPVWQSIVPRIGYICILPPVALGILVWIAVYILPNFQKIFKDFGTALPPVTRGLIDVSYWQLLGLPVGVLWLFATGLLVYGVLRYAGAIRWDLPGMDWLLRRLHVAVVLEALALAAQRQRPLSKALSTLASAYPHRSIQRRLCAVCDELRGGGDDLESLHRHGLLGQTDLALLQSAQRNGNLGWAAREMADSNRRRFIYRTDAIVQVVFPLVIVAYGLAMAVVASAVFFPIAKLIGGLS